MFRKLMIKGIKSLKQVLWDVRGIALTEVLVAMGIIGIVAVAYLMGISATSKAVMVSREKVNAENLAKSQMEYIRSQPYDEVNNPPQYQELSPSDIPETYSVIILTERLDPEGDGTTDDDGLQKLTVFVNRDGSGVFQLEGYRMNR